MSGFSTRSEEAIERRIDVETSSSRPSQEELIEKYELSKCAEWINENNFKKVCLQFPDLLLNDSVEITLCLEEKINKKLYILGDTSYGSCCVDEVAAEHITSDAIIHFGHTCLSPCIRLPVLYVFPKYVLDVVKCITVLKEHIRTISSNLLLILDVGYSHYSKAFQDGLCDCDIIIAEPITTKNHKNACSRSCLLLNGGVQHSICTSGRGYCISDIQLESLNIVFIGPKDSHLLYNLRISFKGPVHCYSEDDSGLQNITVSKAFQRRWYLIERLRDANTVGVIVGTLGVNGYLEAIKQVCTLIRRKGKKCYVISIGKPTVAKLANFPEIEIYVMISCPEAVLENEKDFYQPITSIMEAEMALNEARTWNFTTSSDFRDVIPGGKDYIEIPDSNTMSDDPDVSLLNNKIRYSTTEVEDLSSNQNGTVQLRSDMTVDVGSSNLSNRSWKGLDPQLGQVPVEKLVKGRSGIAQGYSNEIQYTDDQ